MSNEEAKKRRFFLLGRNKKERWLNGLGLALVLAFFAARSCNVSVDVVQTEQVDLSGYEYASKSEILEILHHFPGPSKETQRTVQLAAEKYGIDFEKDVSIEFVIPNSAPIRGLQIEFTSKHISQHIKESEHSFADDVRRFLIESKKNVKPAT